MASIDTARTLAPVDQQAVVQLIEALYVLRQRGDEPSAIMASGLRQLIAAYHDSAVGAAVVAELWPHLPYIAAGVRGVIEAGGRP